MALLFFYKENNYFTFLQILQMKFKNYVTFLQTLILYFKESFSTIHIVLTVIRERKFSHFPSTFTFERKRIHLDVETAG